jgi:2,3-bisphosphoglycerate-dependent phosphoglycerate mutase
MLTTIYLVRHAAPNRDLGVPYDVEPGPPLSDLGRNEAVQTALWLRERGIEVIYASPFERTQATAKAMSENLHIPIQTVSSLCEGGPNEQHPAIRERVQGLLNEISTGSHSTVALVTHGICVQMVLQLTTNNTIDLRRHVYDYGNHSPTAGVWHGHLENGVWRWDLAFKPSV